MKNPIDSYIDIYRQEAYVYFDKHIHSLPKKESGEFDESGGGTHNSLMQSYTCSQKPLKLRGNRSPFKHDALWSENGRLDKG